jgi:hypothetical protein
MRRQTLSSVAIVMFAAASVVSARQSPVPSEPGVYAETAEGPVVLKKTFSGIAIAGSVGGSGARALVFPISTVDAIPSVPGVAAFLVNLPTVQDVAAAGAQMRFTIGEHVREPDYETMAVQVGKFRIGLYRISSAQLTHDWLSRTYAKLTNSRKWRDKRPPAMVGLILNGEMYPVRIIEAALTAR